MLLLGTIIPVLAVYAASASCTGSSPVECTASDALNFADNAPNIILGKIVPTLTDNFSFSESTPVITLGVIPSALSDAFSFMISSFSYTVSNSGPSNVFTQTTSTENLQLQDTQTIVSSIVTQLVTPIIFVLVVMFIATKMGMHEFPILLGIVVFVFSGLIYAGILPVWMVFFPILFAGAVMSLLVSKWLGARGTTE